MTLAHDIANEQLAGIAKALAHPARIQIVRLLLSKTSCIGGEITHQVGLAQSTVSEHLRILKAAGVVIGEIEHPRVCYSLNLHSLLPLMNLLQLVANKATAATGDGLCCPLTTQSCDQE